ncbi:MAG: type II toxin-antitoxin system VapC family toxin [Actinomycetota bacterium]
MGLLIDTSVFIQLERSRTEVGKALAPLGEEELFISCVTASELLHGLHRASDPSIRLRRAAFIEAMLEQVPVLPIDLAVARTHAQLWAELAARGELIGPHDLWLAATCIRLDMALLTVNRREFQRVPGLRVESWT